MSHRFKPKSSARWVPPRASDSEAQLRRMAAMVQNEEQLEAILAQTKPGMRDRCRERIIPFLRFRLTGKKVLANTEPLAL